MSKASCNCCFQMRLMRLYIRVKKNYRARGLQIISFTHHPQMFANDQIFSE